MSDTRKPNVPAPKRSKDGLRVAESSRSDIAAFLEAAKQAGKNAGRGRIVLALDATMSRQPTWDMASSIQARMFETAAKLGTLKMQLVYFRGHGECRASRWASDGKDLAAMMSKIDCRAGHTQIGKVLKHVTSENANTPLNAVVYIGDAVEEDADALGHLAGELGIRGVPLFAFQEGHDAHAETVLRELARLTRGGWFRFDRNAPHVLSDLLASIATYATGGLKALTARGSASDRLLLEQMGADKGKER